MTVVPNNKKIPSRVSIIVNAFNSARYLNQCIDSVLRQTYPDIELIIVDDCSTDDTLSVINKRAEEDSRIKKVNLSENVGAYWSRMKGLPFVTGEYIAFVDSDDWIEPGMYEAMLKAAQESSADVVLCGAKTAETSGIVTGIKVCFKKSESIDKNILEKYCNYDFGSGVMWNKLYRTELILANLTKNYERGPDCPMDYDYLVNVGVFSDAKKIRTLPELFYTYVQREGSSSRQGNSAHNFAKTLRGYVTCLETHSKSLGTRAVLIDNLYSKQLKMPSYMVERNSLLDEVSPSLEESLRRLAEIRPQGIYELIHSFNPNKSRNRPGVRNSLRLLLKSVETFLKRNYNKLNIFK